jgi:amino acid adenylation domain-containing protein
MIASSPQLPTLFVLDAALRAEQEYWVHRLAGGIEPAGPPRDASPERESGTGGGWRCELPADLARRLQRLSGGSPLPLFAALMAGLAACLTRWSGHRQAWLGSSALAAVPANMVALRIETVPEASFRQLLLATRNVLREAYARQRYPWSRLTRDLGSTEGGAPHLRVVAMLAGLHGELPEDLDCELVLRFAAMEGRLDVEVTDRRGHYLRSGLERFLGHWATGLSAALTDLDRPLWALDWLTEPERHQLRHEWQAGAAGANPAECLHRLVAAQAAATPENVAVIAGGRRLTYRELESCANRLARRLISLGVQPETRVGVLLPRSGELVVALLAALKAGAAYVPLDPALPGERLRFLLADSRASLLLTEPALLDRAGLGRSEGPPALGVDLELAGDDPGDPAVAVSPDGIAYVIYTSGSTGRPKGVMIPHRGLVSYLRWCAGAYEVVAGAGTPVHTSIGFDLTVTSLWSSLIAGRYVWMLPGDSPAEALVAARAEGFRLSLAKLTPAHLELLRDTLSDLSLAGGARVWVLGGEALHAEQVAPWRERAAGSRWINEYGPTETVVGCCVHEVGPEDPGEGLLPIGRPITGAILRLLAPDLAPVPVGEVGELYVGGTGMARGYWDQPALTAERFVPDAWGESPGVRLYRTGDLAVQRPDGVLVYLGRQDGQVKIRGHRIEVGEIESALRRHAAVHTAVVVVREDVPGQKKLVAYIVPDGEALPSIQELRADLGAALPEPMVPGAFVILQGLPLTPNGKLDRAALPMPAPAGREGEGGEGSPLQPLEEILGGIWAEVLGVDRVRRGESFFDLGGHSLLAAQVVARLRRTLGIELPVRTFFEAPTLGAFTAAVEALRDGRGTAGRTTPLERSAEPRELSPAQENLWFFHQLETAGAAFNISSALRLAGSLDLTALEGALDAVVRRHEVLHSAFPARGGLPAWALLPPGAVFLSRVDLSGLREPVREREMARLAREEAARPFDLGRGPLLRTMLLTLRPGEHLLTVVLHHIVGDGWSMAVLTRDLTAAYRALAEGRVPGWPELAVRFADVARWQRRRLAAGELEENLSYWRSRLAGAPPLSSLPPDVSRGRQVNRQGALLHVELPAELSAAVRALARRQGATTFMVLLAAFAVVLRHAAGQDDLVIGTDLANRGRLETESLVGFFVHQLPLRLDLSRDPAFADLLSRVRETALGAYDHQEVSFGQIVDSLKLDRTLRVSPLFQVKLIVQNFPQSVLEAPGLVATPVFLDGGTAQLDLLLALEEGAPELRGWINYSTALYEPSTLQAVFDRFRTVLEIAAAQPEVRLSALDGALARKSKDQKEKGMKKPDFSRFKKVKPKVVDLLAAEDMVETGFLREGETLPLVISPRVGDLDLAAWVAGARSFVDEKLRRHGAVLFRGFGIDAATVFERFAGAVADGLFNENGEHPRESVTGNVYTPVFYPPSQQLLWHNENSFNLSWPRKILFCCAKPAETGGETPVVDSRQVFQRLDPALRERFLQHGVMYMRNYGDGLGLDWRTVFRTDSRDEAESICRRGELRWDWRDGDRLRTRAVRPAAARHPVTGEMTWFNQAQHWHLACLDPETRRSIRTVFKEEDYPRHCYLGDGSPIADEEMERILDVYRELEVSFRWEQGDVMLLDNILAAHGRNPFTGERKLLVALGEMTSYADLDRAALAV